ncbi:MAG: DUF2848 family protein [Phycisphaeraceae bacterium]|nr:DUF2848 family protein [Phycisphaeraceae bacterium]
MSCDPHRLELTLAAAGSRTPVTFDVRRVVNVGFAGRDQDAVLAHIRELAEEGVPAPPMVPMLFPVLRSSLTTGPKIEVAGERNSGEVEFVLLVEGDHLWVGVGSDHTDRALEATDMLASKQVCANVLGGEVWDYRELEDHWDELVLESWVGGDGASAGQPYQKSAVSALMSPGDLLAFVKSKMPDGDVDGLVLFGGTVPVLGGKTVYGGPFRCALRDPRRGRELSCGYEVKLLNYLSVPSPAAKQEAQR